MKRLLFLAFLLSASAVFADDRPSVAAYRFGAYQDDALVALQQPVPEPMPKYPRGHVQPTEAMRKAVHAEARAAHGARMAGLPVAQPEAFSCIDSGWVLPVGDQGNCGSCWLWASSDGITSAFVKSGWAKPDGKWKMAQQYTLDGCNFQNGGCNGGWGVTVVRDAKSKGLPLEQDYGPYTAHSGPCKLKAGTKLWKIEDWGFCTPGQEEGMSTTQDIKNAMAQYGVIITAIAANSDWDSYRSGVMPFRRLTAYDVNHEVEIVGWDNSKTVPGTSAKGAFLVRNQWSTQWGDKGYAWIGYGSHQIGTEAIWVKAPGAPVPPPPPPPGPATGKLVVDPDTKTVTLPKGWKVVTPKVEPNGVQYGLDRNSHVIDLSGMRLDRFKQRVKNRIIAHLDDDAVEYSVKGDKIIITKAVGVDWNAFLDFLQKLLPIILQIIEMFGGLADPAGGDGFGCGPPTPDWHLAA